MDREDVRSTDRKKKMACTGAIEEEEDGVDRISNLPDSLIHHIFSFMDTKHAVRTCLLSTRFKDLWISVPNLNFDSRSFNKFSTFTKFVSHVLSRRDTSTLSTFNFARTGIVEPRIMTRIINYATDHNVQQLNINVSSNKDLPSLPLLFNCKSLTSLTLRICDLSQILFPSINLPALTTLHLKGVSFYNLKDKCSNLFSNCLNLKNLTLCDCLMGFHAFTIFSPQLANLTLHYSRYKANSFSCKFFISAPKLSSLQLYEFPPLEFSVDNLPSLETIEIAAHPPNDGTYFPIGLRMGSSEYKQMLVLPLINTLQELCNAKFITLNPVFVEILSLVPSLLEHQPSPFADLKSLKLRSITSSIPNHVTTYLLNRSPSAAVVVEVKEFWWAL